MSFHVVFGFRTPSASEVPDIIYIGADGDKAQKKIDNSEYPRIARVTNPMMQGREVVHWTEEAAAAFEEKHGKELGPAKVPPPVEVTTEGVAEKQRLEDLTVQELKDLAAEKGVHVKSDAHKADIIVAIEAA